MSSATLTLVVLVTVVLVAILVIRLLRPRRREGPASEDSTGLAGWANSAGHTFGHDVSYHSPPADAPSHGSIDGGGHGSSSP
jgi:hypothetical protein